MPRPTEPPRQDYPEPDGRCHHCDAWFFGEDVETRTIECGPRGLLVVQHAICPSCGEVMWAVAADQTGAFLESWRSHPDEMEETIDDYAELKEVRT